ncbi:MAG: 16S rRNA processing protein RimM [Solirubrobacterales bacterium]|nr:16S rRNA processing protein RimM [Solirubrobacterales bacterium]MBV9801381.1 16S rRNA processing protein RimM [Solirubrobacterales bacterium]
MATWLRAGRVGRPHGLDGSFHVSQPNPGLLTLGAHVTVGDRELRITRRAGTDARPILRLEGCEERSCAEAMTGVEILVARHEAPELGPDEWWADDLEGCTVHDQGQTVGVVRRLLQLPSCEVLEVAREDGAGELLVPLVSDAVRSIDVERGEIEIDLRFLGAA